jgi:hypothetical protein
LAFSYWIDYLGFITERKLATIFIKPSLRVSNWPVIYFINYTPSNAIKFSGTIHHRAIKEPPSHLKSATEPMEYVEPSQIMEKESVFTWRRGGVDREEEAVELCGEQTERRRRGAARQCVVAGTARARCRASARRSRRWRRR